LAKDVPAERSRERHGLCRASQTIDALRQLAKRQEIFSEDKMKTLFKTIRTALGGIAPAAIVLLLTTALFAQGPIFTGDASNLSNIIREALKLMAIILFCLGAVGIAWSIYNKLTGKEWGNQAFGSLLAFAFGTIVAVFWQLAQGRAVGIDTNF